MGAAGLRTALKGGARVLGGAVGMLFSLPEAIDSWSKAIEENHETEASKSLKVTAKEIQDAAQTLQKKLDEIKTMLTEMATAQDKSEDEEVDEIMTMLTEMATAQDKSEDEEVDETM
ncbi:uncharacterized protein KZ484_024338 [Pholidichthys leucotaenia]